MQHAKALRRSEITHFRWSPAFGCLVHQCRQARGGIPLVAISVRACMPEQRIFTRERWYWYTFSYFDLTEGSLGNTEADWRRWRQTRFGWTCPQRTQTTPIYSAQFRPSVRKRTKVARELRDPTPTRRRGSTQRASPLPTAADHAGGCGRVAPVYSW